jgi:hypothetical protein
MSLVEEFKLASPEQRRLFLAVMAVNHSDPDSVALHAILSELHETLGDYSDE